jgi:integrase/recombinase XerD
MDTPKRSRKRPPETYTPEEMGRVLSTVSQKAPTGIRNRAMLALGYRAGLRVSEVLGLYPKHVNTAKGKVRVLQDGAGKGRTVGLDEQTCTLLDLWLQKREELGIDQSQPLFCTISNAKGISESPRAKKLKTGTPLESAYVRMMMKRISKKAGLHKRFYFQGLRRTFAKELLEEGVQMPYIQRLLGHSSLATTQRYLQIIAPLDVINVVRDRKWDLQCGSETKSSSAL